MRGTPKVRRRSIALAHVMPTCAATRVIHPAAEARSGAGWPAECSRPTACFPPTCRSSGSAKARPHPARRPDLIRSFANSSDLLLHLRVTACLILLYAQPLARIIRLVADDICGNRQVYLRFGTPPAPAPSRSPPCSRNRSPQEPEPAGCSRPQRRPAQEQQVHLAAPARHRTANPQRAHIHAAQPRDPGLRARRRRRTRLPTHRARGT